ncbi:MAG: nicotinamide mononucleotide transporter family protein [Firmicutes bacterium]|nr:nicotinamide mononucleotide transporter family protein [Bacillota bacterium]
MGGVAVTLAIIGVGTYFLLRAINTAELVVSTLSIVSILFAEYTLTRRWKFNQFAFLTTDLTLGILWLLAVLGGNTMLIPFVVMCGFFILFDIYGVFQWIRLERKQKAAART